jgi:hypothetical protein
VGSQRDCTWILGLPGFRVERIEGHNDAGSGRLQVRVADAGGAIPALAAAGRPQSE